MWSIFLDHSLPPLRGTPIQPTLAQQGRKEGDRKHPIIREVLYPISYHKNALRRHAVNAFTILVPASRHRRYRLGNHELVPDHARDPHHPQRPRPELVCTAALRAERLGRRAAILGLAIAAFLVLTNRASVNDYVTRAQTDMNRVINLPAPQPTTPPTGNDNPANPPNTDGLPQARDFGPGPRPRAVKGSRLK